MFNRRLFTEMVIIAIGEALVGQTASFFFAKAAKDDQLHDLGIIAIWLAVIVGGVVLLAVRWWPARVSTAPPVETPEPPAGNAEQDRFDEPLVDVRARAFRNERVELDGYNYVNCTFNNVKFVYRGEALFGLAGNQMNGIGFDLKEAPAVQAFVTMLMDLGQLDPSSVIVSQDAGQDETVGDRMARAKNETLWVNPPPDPDTSEGQQ